MSLPETSITLYSVWLLNSLTAQWFICQFVLGNFTRAKINTTVLDEDLFKTLSAWMCCEESVHQASTVIWGQTKAFSQFRKHHMWPEFHFKMPLTLYDRWDCVLQDAGSPQTEAHNTLFGYLSCISVSPHRWSICWINVSYPHICIYSFWRLFSFFPLLFSLCLLCFLSPMENVPCTKPLGLSCLIYI